MRLSTIKEYEALTAPDQALTEAERKLIAACRAGERCSLSETRPETPTKESQIRADLLRLLITGGSKDCGLQDAGVFLRGGYITGTLDLDFATARGRTTLLACTFEQAPHLRQAHLRLLNLDHSHLPGLMAQGMMVDGSVFLRNLTATGTVAVNGARITGQLACTWAILNGQTGPDTWGKALNAQGVTVGASLFLRNLTATGTVAVNGARITGQLDCTGAILNGQTGPEAWGKALNAQGVTVGADLFLDNLTATGTVDVNGAQITGQLACTGASFDGKGGFAFLAQRARVEGEFIWRRIKRTKGTVHLAAAHVGDLADDLACWPDDLNLDGFTYDRISAAPTDAKGRLVWLAKGSTFDGIFYPQPYTQLARTLFDMGHDREARKVLMEREKRLAAEVWEGEKKAYIDARHTEGSQSDIGWIWLRMWSSRLWSVTIRLVAGYGYAPERALYWSLGWMVLATILYFVGWQAGVMVPNSDVILTSADWLAAMKADHLAPTQAWLALDPAIHYTTFYSLAYAIDVFVPLIDLGQESTWGASTVTWWGWFICWFTFALQLVGWFITALGAAAITGLIKRDRE